MFSGLSGRLWTACSAVAPGDPQLAHDLVEVGRAIPGRIGRDQPETDAVRRRAAVLVEDVRHHPHLHPRLNSLTNSSEYLVVPLVGRGTVIGLLHVDQPVETNRMDDFDQHLLGLFAEGLGGAFERVMFLEQLGALRDQLQAHARAVGDLVDGFTAPGSFVPQRQTE